MISDSKYNHKYFESGNLILLKFIDFLFGLKERYLMGDEIEDLILDLGEW